MKFCEPIPDCRLGWPTVPEWAMGRTTVVPRIHTSCPNGTGYEMKVPEWIGLIVRRKFCHLNVFASHVSLQMDDEFPHHRPRYYPPF